MTLKTITVLVPLTACLLMVSRIFLISATDLTDIFRQLFPGITPEIVNKLIISGDTYLTSKSWITPVFLFLICCYFIYSFLCGYDNIIANIFSTKKVRYDSFGKIFSRIITVLFVTSIIIAGCNVIFFITKLYIPKGFFFIIWIIRGLLFFLISLSVIYFLPLSSIIKWWYALKASLFVGITFLISQWLASLCIDAIYNNYSSYGYFGSFLLVVIWIKCAWFFVLCGLKYCKEKEYPAKTKKEIKEEKIERFNERWLDFDMVNYIYVNYNSNISFQEIANKYELNYDGLIKKLDNFINLKLIQKDTEHWQDNTIIMPAQDPKTFTIGECFTYLFTNSAKFDSDSIWLKSLEDNEKILLVNAKLDNHKRKEYIDNTPTVFEEEQEQHTSIFKKLAKKVSDFFKFL